MGDNLFSRFFAAFYDAVDAPIVWVRENVVVPNRKEYYWYHRQFRRVPTIDQCYTDDIVCFQEANDQFKRDKFVDDEIVAILRRRMEHCQVYEYHDREQKCAKMSEDYEQAAADWFTKYGDLGAYKNVTMAYMKQKHRMVWERRHGPVGSGMKTETV